ncbi:MAG TPA: hypothetical protein PLX03_07670, partial [Candidatus Hydrogenedentes bacterium]|nr:hypothetical protein [Candidatus Hydrogenedentota bacterium]
MKKNFFALALMGGLAVLNSWGADAPLRLVGVTVTPHLMLDSMRYAKPPEPPDGALVTLFLRNDSTDHQTVILPPDLPSTLQNKAPNDLLESGDIAWHDFP